MESNNLDTEPEEQARAETAAKAAHIERCIRDAGYNPDTFRPDWNSILPAFMDCIRRRARGMLLRGSTGCGKTTLLKAIQAVIRPACAYIPCRHAPDLEWLDWAETPGILARKPFILLDDLGTDEVARCYGERRDRIARLILDWADWPIHQGGATAMLIATTNLTGQQIAERYGDRIMSRLLDLRFIPLYAPDYRMQRHMETTP